MTHRDRAPASDAGFDAMLQRSLPGSPPEEAVKEVAPWRQAMKRIIAGLILQMFTLNFWWLGHLLPAAGLILAALGFRALRRENGWFGACFVLTLLRCAGTFAGWAADATIYAAAFSRSACAAVLACLSAALLLSVLFCLWRGLLSVQRKAGLPPHAASAAALLVWYALVCLLALLRCSGWSTVLGMIAVHVLILRSLWRLSKALDEAGYAVRPALNRFPDWAMAAALLALPALGIAAGYLLFGQYPMDWTPADTALSQEAAQVKAQLAGLGFPQTVLDDLAEEDILACAGATQVVFLVNDRSLNDGEQQVTEYVLDQDGISVPYPHTVRGAAELRFTDVAVRLPGPGDRWRVIHHFEWLEEPDFYGTECIQLQPASQSKRWQGDGPVTGRVLCDRDGQTCAASYHSLITGTSADTFAAFSLSEGGTRNRGYLSYSALNTGDALTLLSWTSYTRLQSWLQYPVDTALNARLQRSFLNSDVFLTVQETLQVEVSSGAVSSID